MRPFERKRIWAKMYIESVPVYQKVVRPKICSNCLRFVYTVYGIECHIGKIVTCVIVSLALF